MFTTKPRFKTFKDYLQYDDYSDKLYKVEIYRPNQSVKIIALPTTLSGEEILPEFTLELPIY